MDTQNIVETGAAALLFTATFLVGARVHPLQSLIHDRRTILSFGAGMSTAYVFVHVMPELHGARRVFAESTSLALRYEGMGIYFLALVGFLMFYGLDHLRAQLRDAAGSENARRAFRLHLGGFTLYVWLMAYLLVHNLEETRLSIVLYATAISVHFLSVDHALRHEHGVAYDNIGRFVLAGAAVLGWGTGLLVSIPYSVLALAVAFISGAIMMNSMIMELPSESDGRFLPFMSGGVLYGLILLPMG
jgi:hypothetical protein